MIRFTIRTKAASRDVLAALQAHGAEWRESQIPAELRRIGVFGVECRIHNGVATLSYLPGPTHRFFRNFRVQLRAAITPDPTGGTVVEILVRYQPMPYGAFVGAGLFAAFGIWLFAGSPLLVLPPLMAGSLMAFNMFLLRESNATLRADEQAPAYLIQRVENAVASAEARLVEVPPANDR